MFNKTNMFFTKITKGGREKARKIVTSFLIITTALWAMSAVFIINVPQVQALSGVTASDTDMTGSGLDGRDFTISWTPGTQPSNYAGTAVFVVRNSVTFNSENYSSFTQLDYFPNIAASTTTLMMSKIKDSEGFDWNASNTYKACVVHLTTTPEVSCSSGFTVTSDSVTDTSKPMIQHMSVYSYPTGNKLIIYAVIVDDQTTTANFVDQVQSARVQMYYDGTTQNTVTDVATGTRVTDTPNLFKFQTANVMDRTVKYFLKVTDKAGNACYFTTDPAFDAGSNQTDVLAAARAFSASAVAAGAFTVSGSVVNAASQAINGAKVVIYGYGISDVTTNDSGAFSFSNVPTGMYDFIATKTNYCEMTKNNSVSADTTNINFILNAGDCTQYSGDPTVSSKPRRTYSSPSGSDFSIHQINLPIIVGFDQPLDGTTINDLDASNAASNVYLTSNGTTKIAGAVTYCSTPSSAGCSVVPANNNNVILFVPTADLTPATSYNFVITSQVKSSTGQSIMTNEPDRSGFDVFVLVFKTIDGAIVTNFDSGIGANFGNTAEFMPPFVESVQPAPGNVVRPNTDIVVRFNESMNASSVTTTNFKLEKEISAGSYQNQTITVSLDSANTRRNVTINPSSDLGTGKYRVTVLGGVANARGVPMRSTASSGDHTNDMAFSSNFEISGTNDSTPPTIYPLIANNAASVAINEGVFKYGFSEPLNPATINTSNVTLKRGSQEVSASVEYDPGNNEVSVIPNTILALNTIYTTTFTTGVTDLAGVALSSAQTFTFTTSGTFDTVAPRIRDARCDDFTCTIFFTEQMNHGGLMGASWQNSVLTTSAGNNNWIITNLTAEPDVNLSIDNKPTTYDNLDLSVTIEGVAGLAAGDLFRVTANARVKDLAGNGINTANSGNIFEGKAENSANTYGDFGGGGMFGPPVSTQMMSTTTSTGGGAGVGGIMDMSKMGGFGDFTPEEFMFGEAVSAYPFNPMAGMDSNVFQVKVPASKLTGAVQNDDQFVLTFPRGTDVTLAKQDTYSPYKEDFNMGAPGIITFDTALDTDGISVNTTNLEVTVQLAISGGTPTNKDFLTMDLRGVVNPNMPKQPGPQGYKLTVKHLRAGQVLKTLESMPYSIQQGGSNSITVRIYAGSVASPVAGANGTIFLWGGGPAGPMDKSVTLTDGVISAVEGVAGTSIAYTSLPDGCYGLNTQAFVTLGGNDYFGQDFPEPSCVNGGQSATKNIVLAAASGGGTNTVPVIVKFSKTGGFDGADIDIFAGGSGRFIVKTLDNITTPDAAGYTIRLPENGMWYIGVGPAMPKGAAAGPPDFNLFGGMPPPPTELKVSGLPSAGAVSLAPFAALPPGVAFNDTTDTLTYTIRTNSINVPVLVNDGTNPLKNIEVFIHSMGFGAGNFGTTDGNGQVTMKVADHGPYEIGARKWGMGETFEQIDIRNEGGSTKIYQKGALVTTVTLKIKKRDYYISGRVLKADGNGLGFAPVWADDGAGAVIHGGTEKDGSYTLYVSAGTWTVKSEPPPGESSNCETYSKSVTVSAATGNKSSENISATAGTCFTVTGTLTVSGSARTNWHVFAEQWDTTNDRPSSAGFGRGTTTNSSGVYTLELPAGTYRIGTFDPDFGELSQTAAISSDNTTVDLNSGTMGDITFSFTGGNASMTGFVELKKSGDKNTRFGKPFTDTTSNLVVSMKAGTYTYYMNIHGVGDYSGTAATGDTVAINLSGTTYVALSGTVYDSSGAALPGARVLIDDFTNKIHKVAVASIDGTYSASVKAGTYTVGAERTGYVASAVPSSVSIAANTTNYDFGGSAPDQTGLVAATKTISGTLYKSDGSTPIEDGFVFAEESSTGRVVSSKIKDSTDGTYTLAVTSGTWTVKAASPLHSETTLSTTVNTTDAIADTSKNITLTANAANIPKSKSNDFTASSPITFDDTDNSDMKFVVSGGVLATSGTVSVTMEKSSGAPSSADWAVPGNVAYDLDITSGTTTVKEFPNGTGDLMLEYSETDLPAGTTEANLQCLHYSPEADAYVVAGGGVAVDTTNNTITCNIDHATTFVVGYARSTVSSGGGVTQTPNLATNIKLATDGSKVTLTWTDPTGVWTHLNVLRDNQPQAGIIGGNPLATAQKGVQTYTDTSVEAGKTYKYILQSSTGKRTANSATFEIKVAAGASASEAAPAPAPAAEVPAAGAAPAPAPAVEWSPVIAPSVIPVPAVALPLEKPATPASIVRGWGCKALGKCNRGLIKRLVGNIILAVKQKGEAFYVNPVDKITYYLGRPADAFNVMRFLSLGVNEENFTKIEAGNAGLWKKLRGRIVLRVDNNGEAWYLPVKGMKALFLGRPKDAFRIMREQGVGVSNEDLGKIDLQGESPTGVVK